MSYTKQYAPVIQEQEGYNKQYLQSIQEPEKFWAKQADDIDWFKKPEQILSKNEKGFYRWFKGGKLNLSYLTLDYHVDHGRADQNAIIYDSPVTNTIRKITYRELRDQVATFAGALQKLGVVKGDRVVIYMPMIPEAAVAMLACARIGAIHSVVFGGFAPHELAVRIDDATPKVIVTASCGIEISHIIAYKPLVDRAISEAHFKPQHVILFERPQVEAHMTEGRDLYWHDTIKDVTPAPCVEVDATDPLYILYTSGTTGKPKGIVRDSGGYAVALKYSMHAVYNVKEGDVFWSGSDVGWVVGHSYIVYAPLLHGCTTIFYEGKPIKTPDAGAFWRVIEEHKVRAFFTAPTAIRAIKKEDPDGLLKAKYDLSSLQTLFLAGERCDPATYHWAHDLLNVPVIDHWWQTESGWAIAANMMGVEPFPVKPGSATKAVCGYDVQALDEAGHQVPPNKEGSIVVKLPLPPGCLPTLWNDDDRFERYLTHYEGYYYSGDGGYIDEDGYIYIMGRIDDVMNVSGHRLSTGEMEEMLARHPAVAECTVIGVADDLRGHVPVGFVVLKDGVSIEESKLQAALVEIIRDQIGAIACFKQAAIVQRLPKTRSGKILRGTMRKIADGEPYVVPSTIDDPKILDEITGIMKAHKIGKAFL
jgi:acetate--CoA ligase